MSVIPDALNENWRVWFEGKKVKIKFVGEDIVYVKSNVELPNELSNKCGLVSVPDELVNMLKSEPYPPSE